MNLMLGDTPVSRRTIYKCESPKDVLASEHFYQIFKSITTRQDIEGILRNAGEKGKIDNEDKSVLKEFLESDITREKGEFALGLVKLHIPKIGITDYVKELFGENGIDVLITGIASLVGITLFSEREQKLAKMIFPKIPEKWRKNTDLEARYSTLTKLALENEGWRTSIGKNLQISDDKIVVNGIEIPLNCIPIRVPGSGDYKGVRFNELAKTYDEYKTIYDFIKSSEDLGIDRKLLMLVLGLTNWLYWLKDENENDLFAKAFDFEKGTKTMFLPRKQTECFVIYKNI